LLAHRKSVRATLLLGDLAVQEGRDEDAIETWKRIEQQNPAYLSLVAQRLLDAFLRLQRKEEGLQLLRGYLEHYASLDLVESVFQLVLDADGAEAAYLLVRGELKRNPTLLGLDKLLEAQLLVAPPERRADLELIKNLIHGQTRRLARYSCEACGFKARQFYWRCPACGGWETYPPRRSEEFENHS
jgi:lipopolysaccharide biosynthesis regulator YciM